MKKRIFLIIPIMFIIAVLITAIIYYYGYYIKPEQTFKKIVSVINNADNILMKSNFNTYKCKVNLDINLQNSIDKINDDMLDLINNSNIDIETVINKIDKQIVFNFSSSYNNDDMLNLRLCSNVNNKESYVLLEDYLNKYLKIEIKEKYYNILEDIIIILENKEISDIEFLNKEITKLINKESCSSAKEKIIINNIEKNVTKNTLTVQFEDLINIFSNISTLKDDVITKYKDAKIIIDVYKSGILKDKLEKIDITITNDRDNIKITKLNNIYYYEIVIEDKSLQGIFSIEKQNDNIGKFSIILETDQLGKIRVELDYLLEFLKKTELTDVSNNTNIETLTNEELIVITENFKKSNLYSLLESII